MAWVLWKANSAANRLILLRIGFRVWVSERMDLGYEISSYFPAPPLNRNSSGLSRTCRIISRNTGERSNPRSRQKSVKASNMGIGNEIVIVQFSGLRRAFFGIADRLLMCCYCFVRNTQSYIHSISEMVQETLEGLRGERRRQQLLSPIFMCLIGILPLVSASQRLW